MFCRKNFLAGTVFMLLAGTVTLSGAVKKSYSFDALPDAGEMIIGKHQDKHVYVKDGVLNFRPGDKRTFFGGVTFPLEQYAGEAFKANGMVKISFRMRLVEKPQNRRDYHSGFSITTGNDYKIRMFYFGGSQFTISHFEGKKRLQEKIRGGFSGKKEVWHNFSILLNRSEMNMFMDGKKIYQTKADFSALQKIFFYAYNMSIDIDDLKLEQENLSNVEFIGKPLLKAGFRDSFDAFDGNGGKISSKAQGKITYGNGISGKGLFLQESRSSLAYTSQIPFFSNLGGGVMFWIKPGQTGNHMIFSGGDGKKEFLKIFQSPNRVAAEFQTKGAPSLHQRWGKVGLVDKWHHIAVTWHHKKVRIYINGLPYTATVIGSGIKELNFPDLETINTVKLYGKAVLNDLQVFRRPLKADEIYSEYRKFMPIDLVIQNNIFTAGNSVRLQVQAAPGGELMVPMPLDKAFIKASPELVFKLRSKSGKNIFTFRNRYDIKGIQTIELPPAKLAPGSYYLDVDVLYNQGCFTRTFDIAVAPPLPAPAPAGKADYVIGKRIYHKKFTKDDVKTVLRIGKVDFVTRNGLSYLEAEGENERGFGLIIPFAKEYRGKPVLLRIHWPDDKTRSMGLLMFRKGKGANRDRLQGGIQSGNEYPETGKMVRTDYIFWPGTATYLFEALTKARNMPAAVSEVEVFEIKGGLPALSIQLPEGLPDRKFGFFDEDQSFITNLNKDIIRPKEYSAQTPFYLRNLLEYYRYTGQNIFAMPGLRYTWIGYNTESMSPRGDLFPRSFEELSYIFDMFGKNGVEVTLMIDIWNLPEVHYGARTETKLPDDIYMKYKDGRYVEVFGAKRMNFMHPLIRSMFLKHIRNFARIHKDEKALTAFNLVIEHFNCGEHPYRGHIAGYDDFTVRLFEKETGIKVPESGKAEFLTGPKKKEWIQWRADKVTEFVKAVRTELDKINPRWNLYVTHRSLSPKTESGENKRSWNYLNDACMDLDALKKIPNTYPVPQYRSNSQRWNLHMYAQRTYQDEIFYDPALHQNAKVNGAVRQVQFFNVYYETLAKNMDKDHDAFFSSLDIKPWGRYSLSDCIWAVARLDALEITAGGQPLGTLGREKEMREFASAYRALPALPFRDVMKKNDPVAVRQLPTKNGTYFYVANGLYSGCKVRVKLNGNHSVRDLSTGKNSTDTVFDMKGYELKSFLIPDRKARVVSFEVEIPAETTVYYRKKLDALAKRIVLAEKVGYNTGIVKAKYDRCMKLFRNQEYADLHRLIFSADFEKFFAETKNPEFILEKNQMIRNGHIAVNCGSRNFAKFADGKLFFSDQRYLKGNIYGYTGGLANNADRLVNTVSHGKKELFATELYNISGYKFEVPNGTYTLRLYMRWGFLPGFKTGWKVTVKANGKELFRDLDYHVAMKGKIGNCIVMEFPGISVKDNLLSLDFSSKEPTARLLNAVEVIREK